MGTSLRAFMYKNAKKKCLGNGLRGVGNLSGICGSVLHPLICPQLPQEKDQKNPTFYYIPYIFPIYSLYIPIYSLYIPYIFPIYIGAG